MFFDHAIAKARQEGARLAVLACIATMRRHGFGKIDALTALLAPEKLGDIVAGAAAQAVEPPQAPAPACEETVRLPLAVNTETLRQMERAARLLPDVGEETP